MCIFVRTLMLEVNILACHLPNNLTNIHKYTAFICTLSTNIKKSKKLCEKVLTLYGYGCIIYIESEVKQMAKRRKKKGDKVDVTNLITAIINLIIALSMLIDTILDKGS